MARYSLLLLRVPLNTNQSTISHAAIRCVFDRVGAAQYYVDDDCCSHYQNFRDMQLAAARAHHHRCESLAATDTGPPPPYRRRHQTYLAQAPMNDCRCCPTPSRDFYYDQYTAGGMYDRHPYGPAPPLPARTPVLSARRQVPPYVEGRRPITSPTRPKTPFTEDRRRWPGRDQCYSVFDDPRRAEFETATNPPPTAAAVRSCLMRRRADAVGFTDNGRTASLGHI